MAPAFLFLIVLSLTAVHPGATDEEADLSEEDTSEIIAKANDGISTKLVHGDIAPNLDRNAVPCTSRGCKWPKSGRYVYVPIYISTRYTRSERSVIIRALLTFHSTTCIRFVWKKWWHRNYLYFYSGSGCWSSLGRQRRGQLVSLMKNGCVYTGTVQHEVLHALGFHHEHVRSDRDSYVRILTENIQSGKEHNFNKVATNNLGTPYDFKSVMHYSKYAFSKNGQPTIVDKRNPSRYIGRNSAMSYNDINRVKRLYKCY